MPYSCVDTFLALYDPFIVEKLTEENCQGLTLLW